MARAEARFRNGQGRRRRSSGVRPLPVLLLVAALVASAGCFDREDPDAAPGPSPPTASTPEPTPTPTSPEPTPTPTAPTPTTPAPPARKVVYKGTHDFGGPPAAPGTPPRTENFTLEAGYATLEIRIAISSTAGPTGEVSLGAGVAVRVLDPAGQPVTECTKKDGPGCSKDVPAPAAGSWKVEYAGSGTSKATVTVTGA